MGHFDGKTVIVTGAGRGIGRAEALLLAREGANVVVNDVGTSTEGVGQSAAVAEAVAAEITNAGGSALANTANVASWDEARELVGVAVATFGKLDGLINNAGVSRHKPMHETTEHDFDIVVSVNLKGSFLPLRFAAEHWRTRWLREGAACHAAVVNTASRTGLFGNANRVTYSSTKMGVVGMTLAAARELVQYGVRVNALAPVADTRLRQAAHEAARKRNEPRAGDALPAEPEMAPEAVAMVAAWLLSERADGVNGQVLVARGTEVDYLCGYSIAASTAIPERMNGEAFARMRQELFTDPSVAEIGAVPPHKAGTYG
jgi:NAD(P)-dependent dehydrogenase (short-subunit alcohol dehydrogenase family)